MGGAALSQPATAQVNVRMTRQLKDAGDRMLAVLGISPSELIRAVWGKLGKGGQDAEELVRVAMGGAEPVDTINIEAASGQHALFCALDEMAIQWGLGEPPVAEISDDNDAFMEELEEKWAARGLM